MNFSQGESPDYQCYLLRLRRDGEQRPWRASLHSAATGTLHHFAEIAYLIAFIEEQTSGVEEPAGDEQAQGE